MTIDWHRLADLAHRWIAPPSPRVHETQDDGTCRVVTVVSDGGLALVTHVVQCHDHPAATTPLRP